MPGTSPPHHRRQRSKKWRSGGCSRFSTCQRESGIGFSTGATVANGTCLAAARTGVLLKAGWDPDADGLFGAPPVHVLIGADAHSSLFSSLQLIGFGRKRVITIATDDQGRMLPSALEAAIAGLTGPKIIIAQAGQINTGAFDPFAEIVAIGKAHEAWVHVDGAFGLWARADAAAEAPDRGDRGLRLLGDRWAQVAAGAVRLRLCHRAGTATRCSGR